MRKKRKKTGKILFFLFVFVFLLSGLTIYQFGNVLKIYIGNRQDKPIVKPYDQQTNVFEIKDALDKKEILTDYIKVASDSVRLVGKVTDGPIVYFSPSIDAVWQASTLQSILSRLTIDRKRAKSIDLRYEKPIVQF